MDDPKPPIWYETPAPGDYAPYDAPHRPANFLESVATTRGLTLFAILVVLVLIWMLVRRRDDEEAPERTDTSGWVALSHGMTGVAGLLVGMLALAWLVVRILLTPIVALLAVFFVRVPGVAVRRWIYGG